MSAVAEEKKIMMSLVIPSVHPSISKAKIKKIMEKENWGNLYTIDIRKRYISDDFHNSKIAFNKVFIHYSSFEDSDKMEEVVKSMDSKTGYTLYYDDGSKYFRIFKSRSIRPDYLSDEGLDVKKNVTKKPKEITGKNVTSPTPVILKQRISKIKKPNKDVDTRNSYDMMVTMINSLLNDKKHLEKEINKMMRENHKLTDTVLMLNKELEKKAEEVREVKEVVSRSQTPGYTPLETPVVVSESS